MTTEEFKNRLEELKQAILKELEEVYGGHRARVEELFKAAEANLDVRLELSQLDALPWKPYRSGSGEWIFADRAPELLQRLKASPSRMVEIGDYRYRLQANGKFIARYPRR